jgi:hypothetical protein
MRAIILFAAFFLLLSGCDKGETSIEPLSPTFMLTDTSGHQASVFRSGQDFEMTFVVGNSTGKTLTYYRGDSSPDVIFTITRNDKVCATSIDGYAFIQVPSIAHLDPDEILQGLWRAPNTPAQFPRKVLLAGSYLAHVSFPVFHEVESKQVSAIAFSIIQ